MTSECTAGGPRCYQRNCERCTTQRELVQTRWREAGGWGLMASAVLVIGPKTTFDVQDRTQAVGYHLGLAMSYGFTSLDIDHDFYAIQLRLPPLSMVELNDLDVYLREPGESFFLGAASNALVGTDTLIVGPCIDIDKVHQHSLVSHLELAKVLR